MLPVPLQGSRDRPQHAQGAVLAATVSNALSMTTGIWRRRANGGQSPEGTLEDRQIRSCLIVFVLELEAMLAVAIAG
jgi:hypothetical protein